MRKQEKIGYGLVVVAVLLAIAGSVGFVLERRFRFPLSFPLQA